MGLWHNMVWKKDKKSFKYSELSKKERDRKRLGKGFYASPYKCPICAGVLYMTVYPQGTEKKIETDEGNVYLARAYTCNECTVFFTPRPDLLLAEGDIYEETDTVLGGKILLRGIEYPRMGISPKTRQDLLFYHHRNFEC